jgi:hypothetical protein
VGWHAVLALGLAACALFYVRPFAGHFGLPPGNDAYFYIGAIRDVGHAGLVDPQVAARPAYPLLGAMLSSVSGASPWVATTGIPIALALALGLAGAALAARWGMRGPGVVAFAVLASVSGVAARLVAGKSENLAVLVLVCAMLAVAVWTRGVRRWVATGALGLAAGLTEWPLAGVFVGILGGHLVLRLLRRDREALATLGPVMAGAAGGLAGAVLAVLAGGHGLFAIQHLPFAVRYGPRLDSEIRLLVGPLTLALVVLGWWVGLRLRRGEVEPVRSLLDTWLLLTGLAVVIGLAGADLPTYRALGIALPVALATAAGAFLPARLVVSGRPMPARAAALVASVLLGLIAVVPAAVMWYDRLTLPISPEQVRQIQVAGRYAMSLPDGRKAVFVMRKDAVHFLAYERIVADVLPAGQGDRLVLFLGGLGAAKEAKEPIAFKPQNQVIIHYLFPAVHAALVSGAPILTGDQVDPGDTQAALARGARPIGGTGVAIVRGPPAPSRLPGSSLPDPILPPRRIGEMAAVALAALFLAGMGWSLLALPGSPILVRTALAPSFGLVALPLVAYVAERAGANPRGGAAVAELSVAVAASAAAAVVHLVLARGREPPRVGEPPPADRPVLEGSPGR